MITKVTVENFKSIERMAMELGKLSVFVGPNNAGKTNILDIFGFLSRYTNNYRAPSREILAKGDLELDLKVEIEGADIKGDHP